MPIFIDDTVENHDWIRTTGWDLGTAEDWEAMPIEQVARIVELPAWTQAPDDVRAVAERRLAAES